MASESRFEVQGMKCGGCVAKVTETLKHLPGVEETAVDLASKTAVVKGEVDPQAVTAALGKAGYPASLKS